MQAEDKTQTMANMAATLAKAAVPPSEQEKRLGCVWGGWERLKSRKYAGWAGAKES